LISVGTLADLNYYYYYYNKYYHHNIILIFSSLQEITNVVGIAIKNQQVAWCQLKKLKHEQDHYNQNTCSNILMNITPHPEEQGHTANNAGITHPNLWSVGSIDCKKIFESRIDVVDLSTEVSILECSHKCCCLTTCY
jgi:hypothetical protein